MSTRLWSWDPNNTTWLQVDQGPARQMRETAERRNRTALREGVAGAAYLAFHDVPDGPPSAYGLTPVPDPDAPTNRPFEVGERWPRGLDADLSALLVLVCPCGGHVEATGGSCETCGRTFDEQGRRVVGQGDLDNLVDGNLQADPDPDAGVMAR